MTVEVATLILGSGVIAAAVSSITNIILWFLNNQKKQDDRETDIIDGLQVLLYDKIKYLCLKYIERGHICSDELEDLERMHKIYHDKLDGNGFLDDLMKQARSLPIKGC